MVVETVGERAVMSQHPFRYMNHIIMIFSDPEQSQLHQPFSTTTNTNVIYRALGPPFAFDPTSASNPRRRRRRPPGGDINIDDNQIFFLFFSL